MFRDLEAIRKHAETLRVFVNDHGSIVATKAVVDDMFWLIENSNWR